MRSLRNAKASEPRRAKPQREKPPRGERRNFLDRWRRSRPRPLEADEALLAHYRRRGMPDSVKLALYVLLAGGFFLWGLSFAVVAPFRLMPLIAPLPVMALLLIWLLPQGEYAPTKAIEPLFLAFFASLVLWPNYIAIALPHLPWLTFLRIFGGPLVLVLLVCVSVSANFRRELRDVLVSDRFIWKLFLAYVVLQTISLGLSARPMLSLNQYIVAQTNCTAIFVTSCYLFMRTGFAERWVRMLLVVMYVVCFMGLWESAIGTVPWGSHIPSFLRIDGELLEAFTTGMARASLGTHRVQSVATTPLGMAEMLAIAAPFAIHLAIGRHHIALRVMAAMFVPLALYLIILADSRLGIVGLMSAVLAYVLIWSAIRWRRSERSLLAPTLVLMYPLILVSTILATFFVGRLRTAVWGSGAEQASTDSRFAQWDLAIPKIIARPYGYGLGQAGQEVGFFIPGGRLTLDSYYISVLMDLGVLGFLVFFGMFLRAAWMGASTLMRSPRQGEVTLLLPMAVALLVFIVIKSVFSMDGNHPLVFIILGAIVALTWRANTEATSAESRA